jgi:Protein of unknown function (DUF4245)
VNAKAPRVVAELGRPETPEEEAERRAESSRLRRARQTPRNLVSSLIVCIALVAGIVLLVPRGTPPATPGIDYRSLASQSQASVESPLLAPVVPVPWRANAAELRTADGVTSWYVGFVTSPTTFLAYSEGLHGNTTWLADVLASAPPKGTVRIGGLEWRSYDQRALGTAAGNVAYALATRVGDTYLAVYGTSSVATTRSFAASLAKEAADRGLHGRNAAP